MFVSVRNNKKFKTIIYYNYKLQFGNETNG